MKNNRFASEVEERLEIYRLRKEYEETGDEMVGNALLYRLTVWMFRQCDERQKIDGIDWGKEFLIASFNTFNKLQEEDPQ